MRPRRPAGSWRTVLPLGLVACSALNGAYDGGGGGGEATGSSGLATSTSSTGSANDSTSTGVQPATNTGGGSNSSGVMEGICGDGIPDPGEDCDDGNTADDDGCSADCRIPGDAVWEQDFDLPGPGRDRFRTIAIHQGDLMVGGRGTFGAGSGYVSVLVRFDPQSGNVLSQTTFDNPWTESEVYSLVSSGDRLYASGSAREGTFFAFVVGLETTEREAPAEVVWEQTANGSVARGLALNQGELIAAVGAFNEAGFGIAMFDEEGVPGPQWLQPTSMQMSSFNEVVWLDGDPIVGGMLASDAALVIPQDEMGMFTPVASAVGTGPGRDRIQAVTELDGDVVVGGWLDELMSGRDAWIARYTSDGVQLWEVIVNGGSGMADEVESVAVDQAGNVIAVGMLGEPSIPTIWKFSPEGAPIWVQQYPEAVENDGFFRDVVVDDDIYVVGEREIGPMDSQGMVLRIVP